MKRIILSLLVLTLFASCDRLVMDDTKYFLRSYVNQYNSGSWKMYASAWRDDPHQLYLQINGSEEDFEYYSSPETGGKGKAADTFVQIAERNGDRSYNQKEVFIYYSGRMCCADNFKSVRVACLNKAWDDDHAAGESLNDIIRIRVLSYAPYVWSGYQDHSVEQGHIIEKPLSELSDTDLTMIQPDITFYYDKLPSTFGDYKMEVTMVTTEGVEQSATCMFVFNEER